MVDDEYACKRKRLGRSGFTLIELMIASGVVAMSMGVMFGSLISIGVLGQVAEGKTEATAYMMSVLEQVRGMSRANLFTYTPQAPPRCPGFTMALALDAVKADGSTLRLPLSSPTAGSSLPAPFAVRATVVFTTPRGHMYSVTSTTYAGTY